MNPQHSTLNDQLFLHTTVDDGDYFQQILAWTLKSRWQKQDQLLREITGTFHSETKGTEKGTYVVFLHTTVDDGDYAHEMIENPNCQTAELARESESIASIKRPLLSGELAFALQRNDEF